MNFMALHNMRMLCAAIIPGTTLFAVLCLLSLSTEKVPADREAEDLHFAQFGRREANSFRTKGLLYEGNGTWSNRLVPGMHIPLAPGNPIDINNSECETEMCAEYLSEEDVSRYEKCWKKTKHYNVTRVLDGGCRFVDGRKREAVALASFPGSGNTWVRDLLEKVTGVCTGAYCCDISLRATGFTGEFIQSGSVLVVKTHRSTPMWKDTRDRAMFDSWEDEAVFGAAIVIIRNPLNALVSEWNRIVANGFRRETVRLGTHTNKAEEWHFRTNRKWSEFLHREAYHWKEMVDNWVVQSQPRHPVLVVRYEDLKSNVLWEVKRMLDFLQFPYSEEQLRRKLKVDYRSFKRQHSADTFNPYTNYQRTLVRTIIHQTINLAKQKHLANILRLEDYLR